MGWAVLRNHSHSSEEIIRLRLQLLPLSGVGNAGGFGDEETPFCGALRVIQYRMWLRNVVI